MMTRTEQRTHDPMTHRKPRTWMQKWGVPLGVGAVAGFVSSFVVLQFIDSDAIGGLSTSSEIAILVALLYFVTAMAVLIGLVSPALGERFLNVEDADELREQRAMLLNSGIAMTLWAGALAALALAGSEGPLAQGPVLAGAIAAILAGLWFAWKSYKASDELMTAVNMEATALSYFLTFAVLGGWAILAHSGILGGPAPLDMVTTFYVVVLVGTGIAAGRRGMLNRR